MKSSKETWMDEHIRFYESLTDHEKIVYLQGRYHGMLWSERQIGLNYENDI